ncbi:MAG: alpha/beta hydrolase fold [Burkholderiales bacterium]|jgi:pimeloyl-ACP methyl ester carboxylesterase|nr:alpha/beta hydrolase fold [Burkholderiales bacterium]
MSNTNNFNNDLCQLIFNRKSYISCTARRDILQVTDGCIEYSRFGVGKPIILITGYAASMNGWDLRFLDELAKSHDVIVFSNRHTGNSKFISKKYTLACLAKDVESLRVGLGLNLISLIGISLGGVIAQQYAYMYPQNLRHLTIINSLPPGNLIVPPKDDVVEILKNVGTGKLPNFWQFSKLLLPSMWYFFTVAIFHFKAEGSKNIVSKTTLNEQAAILEDWSLNPQPISILEKITTPTLILIGEADKLIPPVNSKILNKNIKGSKLVSFNSGSHLMIFQYPVDLARVITKDINNH